MVQYRKSKKAGPFRFTVSNSGISTSVGYGPLRITRRADGRCQRTARLPGTGIRDTKIIRNQRRAPAAGQPNIPAQLGKLILCLLGLGFILSVVTHSLAVGFGIVGAILVGGLVAIAVSLVGLIRNRRASEATRRDEP
jgi:hypothetical protein